MRSANSDLFKFYHEWLKVNFMLMFILSFKSIITLHHCCWPSQVFKQAYIPRTLDEVVDFERDLKRMAEGVDTGLVSIARSNSTVTSVFSMMVFNNITQCLQSRL